MSITEKILNGVKAISTTQRIRKRDSYIVGTAILNVENYNTTLDKINLAIEPVLKNGEKITSEIRYGEIVDSGIKGYDIIKGVSIELYDYNRTSAIFIRLYHIKDNEKEWLALYIDENPDTPWWTSDGE